MSWAKYEEDNRHIAQERWAGWDEHKKNSAGYSWNGYQAGNTPPKAHCQVTAPHYTCTALR